MPDVGGNGRRIDRPPRGVIPPLDAYPRLVKSFGVARERLRKALHKIKHVAGLPPDADTLVDADGNVYIASTGEWIGNLVDEH